MTGNYKAAFFMAATFLLAGNAGMAQSVSPADSLYRQTHPVVFQPKPVSAKSFVVPALFIATGAVGVSGEFIISNPEIKEARDEHFKTFQTSVDNYLQFAPLAAGYVMLINNPQHSFWKYTEKVLLTEVIVNGLVQPAKRLTKVWRPDSSNRHSFPSGHTAEAFAGATIFCDEFAQHNTWLYVSAYGSATAVGVLRILNNRHWSSDVIAGAGFGILSAKLSEWIVEPHGKKRRSLYTVPL